MARLKRSHSNPVTEDTALRLRAAWMYYDRKMTQKEIAAALGIARTTVIRLLEEVLRRREVQIWIDQGAGTTAQLASELEKRLGLDEAIVVPETSDALEAARSVGAALGRFLSETIENGMTVGVGWGRTLTASLASFRPTHMPNAHVISLLGGMINAGRDNSTDFAWQLASRMGAECFLYPAPLIVDSPETARILREECGLSRLDNMAAALDVALVSVGDIGWDATSLSRALISRKDYEDIQKQGGICDLMCNALDAQGRTVDHDLNKRVMSVDLSLLAKASHVVIAAGGSSRAPAIIAAIRRIGCHTLVTDEGAARAILAQWNTTESVRNNKKTRS